MLYALLETLLDISPDFQILRYITLRSALAAITAFLFCLIASPPIIRILSSLGVHEDVGRSDSEQLNHLHAAKENTPTMGGLIFLLALVGSTLIWARLDNPLVLCVLGATLSLAAVGFVDDYIKLTSPSRPGLRARTKLLWQGIVGLAAGLVLIGALDVRLPSPATAGPPEPSLAEGTRPGGALSPAERDRPFVPPAMLISGTEGASGGYAEPQYTLRSDSGLSTSIFLPFFKRVRIPLGLLFILLVALVVTASSNAVNLTDGLDGLACGSLILVSGTFAALAYVVGRVDFAGYLLLPYVAGAGELTIFCSAMVGAGMGFLWHNCHPATVFLGDTGALPLGGAIGLVSVILKQEALLLIVGGIFVAETLSVMLQVASYKMFGRRIFRIAPLHHHFQFLGWPESKVTVRFWIIGAILALVSLVTLKVR